MARITDGCQKEKTSMAKPVVSFFVTGILAAAGLAAVSLSAPAADMPLKAASTAERCGPCGCVQITYDYHRELRTTYGTAFDPRNFDQTQPHFYFGPVRRYAQYWTDANC
jgi:hypothetical protein